MDEMSLTVMENTIRFVFSIHFAGGCVWVEIYNGNHLLYRRLRPITDQNKIDWSTPVPYSQEELITSSVRNKANRFLKLKAFW
jgi:hypothetical protein